MKQAVNIHNGWRNRIGSLFMLLWLILLSRVDGQAQTFHAILIADTLDPDLKKACKRDIATMRRQFSLMASAIKYTLREELLAGPSFNTKQVGEALQRLTVQPHDIVFLYYTGHGYNERGRVDRFPLIMVEKDPLMYERNPALAAIHEIIKSKKPRLCITLGDCCNRYLPRATPGKRPAPLIPGIDSLSIAYQSLFLNVKGDVLIASSQPPQVACAHPDSGSFYTRAFDEALLLAGRTNEPISWESLLTEAQSALDRWLARYKVPTSRQSKSIYAINVLESELPEFTLPKARLQVEVRTDLGRIGVTYQQGSQIYFEAKVSRPCHLRLISIKADNTQILLENDLEIKPGQENQFIRIAPDFKFLCSEPFGTEQLLAFASEEPFCPIPSAPNQTLYVRKEDYDDVLVGSFGEMIKAATCTRSGKAIVEDRIQYITKKD